LAALYGGSPGARRSPGGGAALSRPAGGTVGGAGQLRQRRHPAGPDHRGTTVNGERGAESTHLVVIGAGPCGLAVGIAAKGAGIPCVLLDRRNIVSTIERYPLAMTF